ncbi:unnamed protein product [Vitrella brassicaformis CCMP3155]|uniref:T-cell immunomodulatory protein TIP C2 domain-containing protein n=1 Tax=Vitrella brassicaformis (strain CCMP3155) TaxID=1169540 RepID=A0A0G4H2W9_VITBC|nr:unnamed protein product [Vitrella brassicaformis CCMP3155]|eukprot:CEM38020.1 unnamed protein product [Vitrella brassicaformis CCMP3155]
MTASRPLSQIRHQSPPRRSRRSRLFIASCLLLLIHCLRHGQCELVSWDRRDVGSNKLGELKAFGDWDSDKFLDLIVFDKTSKPLEPRLTVSMWDDGRQKFRAGPGVDTDKDLQTVIATDWNMDGRLDLFGIFGQVEFNDDSTAYRVKAWCQTRDAEADPKLVWQSANESSVQPFIVDINSDGKPDLLGQTVKKERGESPQRFVWINRSKRNVCEDDEPHKGDLFEYRLWEDLYYEYIHDDRMDKGGGVGVIASPHSSAFVDIDGDCEADIVFDVQSPNHGGQRELEIWLHEKTDKKNQDAIYRRHRQKEPTLLPEGAGQLMFADFNADGTIDIAFPSCTRDKFSCDDCCVPSNNVIYMTANRQQQMCPSMWIKKSRDCRPQGALCQKDLGFAVSSFAADSRDFTVSALVSDTDDPKLTFTGDFRTPVTLRVGDFDLDGYPDLIGTVQAADQPAKIRFFKNYPTSDDGASPLRKFKKAYELSLGGDEVTADGAAFFDVGEDGILDVIGFGKKVKNGKMVQSVLQVFEQKADADVFFLKSTGLNPVCAVNCPPPGPSIAKPKPYGVSYHGPSFKITVTDLNGVKTPKQAAQLPQSAHTPLGLPFVFFGLGRTNNYIEEFFMGLPLNERTRSRMWTSLIPNTQVIVRPYPQAVSSDWSIELSVSPSKKFLFILLATVTCLLIVGAIIFFLDRREKAEDLKEQQEKFRVHFITA